MKHSVILLLLQTALLSARTDAYTSGAAEPAQSAEIYDTGAIAFRN
jgi:hypothetical protein